MCCGLDVVDGLSPPWGGSAAEQRGVVLWATQVCFALAWRPGTEHRWGALCKPT